MNSITNTPARQGLAFNSLLPRNPEVSVLGSSVSANVCENNQEVGLTVNIRNLQALTLQNAALAQFAPMISAFEMQTQQLSTMVNEQAQGILETMGLWLKRFITEVEETVLLQRQLAEAQSYERMLLATHPHTITALSNTIAAQAASIQQKQDEIAQLERVFESARKTLQTIRNNPHNIIAAENAITQFHQEQPGKIS